MTQVTPWFRIVSHLQENAEVDLRKYGKPLVRNELILMITLKVCYLLCH